MYKIITLPVVLYGRGTWSLSLGEEHRLKVFWNKVLRRIFEQEKNRQKRLKKNYIMRSFITCTLLQV
jgi:hypothetical protein